MLPKLTIAIAAMGHQVHQIQIPEQRSGISYYVGVQRPDTIPEDLARRNDVEIEFLDSIGLSRSRNAALARCQTDLLLLADDDLIFDLDAVDMMRGEFLADSDLDIATGRLSSTDGNLLKTYPAHGLALNRINSGFLGSPEVMIRMAFVRRASLAFDERFGVGSDFPSGEEYIFVTDALKNGACVRHVAHVIAAHPPMSTGDNWHDPRIVDARARVLTRVWGPLAPLIRTAYAVRKRQLLGAANTLRFALGGKISPMPTRDQS